MNDNTEGSETWEDEMTATTDTDDQEAVEQAYRYFFKKFGHLSNYKLEKMLAKWSVTVDGQPVNRRQISKMRKQYSPVKKQARGEARGDNRFQLLQSQLRRSYSATGELIKARNRHEKMVAEVGEVTDDHAVTPIEQADAARRIAHAKSGTLAGLLDQAGSAPEHDVLSEPGAFAWGPVDHESTGEEADHDA
jgi:hypothetical protein